MVAKLYKTCEHDTVNTPEVDLLEPCGMTGCEGNELQ